MRSLHQRGRETKKFSFSVHLVSVWWGGAAPPWIFCRSAHVQTQAPRRWRLLLPTGAAEVFLKYTGWIFGDLISPTGGLNAGLFGQIIGQFSLIGGLISLVCRLISLIIGLISGNVSLICGLICLIGGLIRLIGGLISIISSLINL